MRRLIPVLLLLGGLVWLPGCALFKEREVIFVDPSNDLVRLDDDCKGHVFVQQPNGQWVRSSKKVKLPAGHYAGRLEKQK